MATAFSRRDFLLSAVPLGDDPFVSYHRMLISSWTSTEYKYWPQLDIRPALDARRGNCADFAASLCGLLFARGEPPSDYSFVTARIVLQGTRHALVVRLRDELAADNLLREPRPLSRRTDLADIRFHKPLRWTI